MSYDARNTDAAAGGPTPTPVEAEALAFASAMELILLLAPDGRILHANDAAVGALGLAGAEAGSISILDVAPEWTADGFGELFDAVHERGATRLETTLRGAGEVEFPVEIGLGPALHGGHRFVVTSAREISMIRAARRQRDLLRAVTVLVIDSQPRREVLARVVARVESVLEARGAALWAPGSADGADLEPEFVAGAPALGTQEARSFVERAWQTEAPVWQGRSLALTVGVGEGKFGVLHVELPIDVGAEERQQLESTFLALGQMLAAYERRRANEAALRIRDRAIEASIDGIAIADLTRPDNELIYVNEGFERITGYTFDEAVGSNCRFLQGPETSDEAREEIREAIRERRRARVTILNYRKDGTPFWNDLQLAPVEDDEGVVRHFIAVQHDISARIEIERDLVDARQRATSASRAKSRFLANMSHELRSPMTAILGFADAIARETREDKTRERISTVRRNADYLLQLIADILDISSIESGKLTLARAEVDLVQLVRDVRDLMRVRADQKGLPLVARLRGPVPRRVHTAPVRLRQILVNLLANAVKFTESGRVDLDLVAERCEDRGRARLRFVIRDTGIGIASDALQRIFQPFSRPHERGSTPEDEIEGAGLGLAIVQRLTKQLGGDIAVSSRRGEGSRFSLELEVGIEPEVEWTTELELPAGEPDAASAAAAGEDAAEFPDLTGRRILVADDRPDVAAVVEFYLSDAGALVELAAHGKEVVDAVSDSAVPFDAIVLDMQMPVMDGFEAAERLRQLGYDGPIVALTAGATKEDEARCLAVGCTAFLSKPAEELDLLQTLDSAITPGKSER